MRIANSPDINRAGDSPVDCILARNEEVRPKGAVSQKRLDQCVLVTLTTDHAGDRSSRANMLAVLESFFFAWPLYRK